MSEETPATPPAGYLRIGEVARRTGTSPELLRAWERRYALLRPTRSAGGFRLYSEADVARVLRAKELIANGVSAAEAARLALATEPPRDEVATPLLEDLQERLAASLDGFDANGAHEAFDELLAAFSVETVLRDAVLPYLDRLGARWERGEVSIAQEHFASGVIRGRLLGLARGWGRGGGRPIVLACPPGEEHEIGLIVFGIVAARRGWRVVYLGANTPFQTLEATVRRLDPALLILAVSDPDRLTSRADEIRTLAETVPVAVGGEISAEDAEGLGLRHLRGDPVSAALALTNRSQ
jgi:DNA-binding transcriptional MerR regulator